MTINFFLFFLSSSPFSSLLLTFPPPVSLLFLLYSFFVFLFWRKRRKEKKIAKRDNREKGKEKRSLSSSSLLAPLSFPFSLFFSSSLLSSPSLTRQARYPLASPSAARLPLRLFSAQVAALVKWSRLGFPSHASKSALLLWATLGELQGASDKINAFKVTLAAFLPVT